MEYDNIIILDATQMAIIRYQYNGQYVYFHLAANEKDLSQGNWKDREKVQVETLMMWLKLKWEPFLKIMKKIFMHYGNIRMHIIN